MFFKKTKEARAVAKAIALLDEKAPADWRSRVNLENLDLRTAMDCVLGHVFREAGDSYGEGFVRGRKVLGFGFYDDLGAFANNKHLPEWRKQITKGLR